MNAIGKGWEKLFTSKVKKEKLVVMKRTLVTSKIVTHLNSRSNWLHPGRKHEWVSTKWQYGNPCLVESYVSCSPCLGLRLQLMCHFLVLTTFWRHLWPITKQKHGNMESICQIDHDNFKQLQIPPPPQKKKEKKKKEKFGTYGIRTHGQCEQIFFNKEKRYKTKEVLFSKKHLVAWKHLV